MARNYRTGIIITGDASGAVRAANLTEEQLKQLNATSKKTSDQFSDIASKTRDVANAAAKWAMVAGGAAVTATAALVKNQMGLISSTANVSDMLGISTEALARLRHQADITGVSANNLDLGIRRMTRRISEAAQGTGAAVKSLDELGLSAEALAKLSPDQQFDAIAEAMEGVENQSDRLRLAFSIFDTDGAALLNTMRGGSAAAEEAARFTDQWGLALSRVDAAKVEQASTAMGMVRTASEGFWKQLTVQLSPAITGIAEDILGWGEGMGTAEEAAQRTFETMTTWAGRALDVFRGVQVVWKGIIALTAELSAQLWETIYSVDEGISTLLNKLPSWMRGGVTFAGSPFAREMATSLRAAADQLGSELHELAMKAMPSDALAARLDKWRKDAEAAAEKVAASAAKTRGGYLATGEALEGLTTQEKARADAVSRALGDLSFQNQLLERELRATQAGEDALKAFNREKHIEIGLRSTNAKDMLPQELALYREQLAAQWDLQEAIRDAGSTTAAVSDDMAKLMEETSRRMGDSLVQVWRDFIDGGSNALDSMKKMLVDFLANAAHLALTRPIMVSLGLAGSVGANAGGIGGGAAGGAG
ncbi:MAG: hypothetical protein M0Q49_01615, partial [Porticoccaceae bacterium]|nr:hypothetical protein [Porticoccaceae bacterium]